MEKENIENKISESKGNRQPENEEIDNPAFNFIELGDYKPVYDEEYLQTVREKATKSWLGSINPEEWLNEIRGRNEA